VRLREIDPDAASRVDPRNARRVIRYLEAALLTGGVSARWRMSDRVPATKIGLAPPRAVLLHSIEERVRRMVADGVLEETRRLVARGLDPALPSMTGHGYTHWAAHLRGERTLEEAVTLTVRDTSRYSKRQMTWFRRDGAVAWIDPTVTNATEFVIERSATLVA
jgi:tRNA dimethylallyltransferase